MELSYLYIKNIERPLNNIEINFSSLFNFSFEESIHRLHIEKKDDSQIDRTKILYGDNIDNIKLLIGKNGTGKTTIMQLLGLDSQTRLSEFKTHKAGSDKIEYAWFAVYHIAEDQFVVEGYNFEFFFGKNNTCINNKALKPFYSVCFAYDYKNKTTKCEVLSQFFRNDDISMIEEMLLVYYHRNEGAIWMNYPKLSREDNTRYTFERKQVDKVHYSSVNKFLFDFSRERRHLDNKHGGRLSIHLFTQDKEKLSKLDDNFAEMLNDGERIFSEFIYGIKDILIEEYRNLGPFTPKTILQLSPKQSFIVIYLQELIGNALDDDDIERTVIHSGYSEEKDGYNERKAFLLKRLKSLCDVNPYVDYELSKRTVDGLEAIPDKYFISDVEISACFSDLDNNCFETLMQVFDENSEKENVRYLYFLRVKIEGLSSGEACYLDLFSSLYYALNDSYNNGVRKKIVLLLDEPDARFHPEWSRRFVETLCDWLNGTMFKQYKYQLIITTHSPLMISDVFKEDVILLDRKEDKFEVRKSKFGLMSGINDILIDSFFTDSLFGSNAVKFVETIIHDMDDVKHFECNSEIIKKKISWIDDEYIKMRLWRKYQYTKAKLEMEKINDKN